jgi:hypothetical protein
LFDPSTSVKVIMATKSIKSASTSTAVAPRKSTAGSIVSIKEQLAAQAAEMADRTLPPGGNAIRLSPGKFTLPDATTTPGPIEAVIVDFVAMNSFYEGKFDKDDIKPPICFAIGTSPLKLAPSPNSPEPQAKTCAECPMNQWGSDGKGKACKNERKLALLPPDADADTPLWMLKVSPTASKNFDAHVNGIARTFQTPPVGAITSISLDPTTDYPKLVFGDAQPNPNLTTHFARQDEAKALLAVEPDVSGYTPAAKPRKTATAGRR